MKIVTLVNKYFIRIFNSWIALPTKKKHEIEHPTNKNDFT